MLTCSLASGFSPRRAEVLLRQFDCLLLEFCLYLMIWRCKIKSITVDLPQVLGIHWSTITPLDCSTLLVFWTPLSRLGMLIWSGRLLSPNPIWLFAIFLFLIVFALHHKSTVPQLHIPIMNTRWCWASIQYPFILLSFWVWYCKRIYKHTPSLGFLIILLLHQSNSKWAFGSIHTNGVPFCGRIAVNQETSLQFTLLWHQIVVQFYHNCRPTNHSNIAQTELQADKNKFLYYFWASGVLRFCLCDFTAICQATITAGLCHSR